MLTNCLQLVMLPVKRKFCVVVHRGKKSCCCTSLNVLKLLSLIHVLWLWNCIATTAGWRICRSWQGRGWQHSLLYNIKQPKTRTTAVQVQLLLQEKETETRWCWFYGLNAVLNLSDQWELGAWFKCGHSKVLKLARVGKAGAGPCCLTKFSLVSQLMNSVVDPNNCTV